MDIIENAFAVATGLTIAVGPRELRLEWLQTIAERRRCLEKVNVVFIEHPECGTSKSPLRFVNEVCAQLGIPTRKQWAAQWDQLDRYLKSLEAAGQTVALLIDDAHLLTDEALDVITDLWNAFDELGQRRLVYTFLAGEVAVLDHIKNLKDKSLLSRIGQIVRLPIASARPTGKPSPTS